MPEQHSLSSRYPVTALVCGLLWLMLPANAARALNSITIDSGYGLDDTRLLRLNLSVGNQSYYPAEGGWHWNRYWEANLSYWSLYKSRQGEGQLLEAGLTPNFRLERSSAWHRVHPYLEAGLGVHLLSKARIGTRLLGSSFQFGTHAGFGVRFGSDEQFDLAWRIEHLSNAGLKEPNPGINFTMVRIGYHW